MFEQRRLLKAVERRELDEIQKVLESENNGCKNCIGTASLTQACTMNRYDIVELLLEYGANPNYNCRVHSVPSFNKSNDFTTQQSCSDFGWQTEQQHEMNVSNLNPVSVTDWNYCSPEMSQSTRNRCFLIGFNPDENSDDFEISKTIQPAYRFLRFPLNVACSIRDIEYDIVKKLVDCGASINSKDVSGLSSFQTAAEVQGADVVRYLLKHNADINSNSDINGKTALAHACAMSKDPEVLKILVAAGSDVNRIDMYGQHPLYEAIMNPFLGEEVVHLLIRAGANLKQDYFMMYAVTDGTYSIMETLYKNGAAVDRFFTENEKNTLHVACERTSVPVKRVEALLKWGAEVNRKCPRGLRPIEYACQDFQLHKVRVLMGWGADMDLLKYLTCPAWNWHLDWGSQYMALINLLVAGGLALEQNSCSLLIRFINKLPGRKGLKARVVKFLKTLSQNPQKLTHLSRLAIRRSLLPHVDINIEKLTMLPENVRTFLYLIEEMDTS